MQLFNEKNKIKTNEYAKNPIVKKTFIKSLYEYPDGVDVEIKNISKLMPDKYSNDKFSIYINIQIIGEMPKCDAYVVDENNEYMTAPDRHGVMQYVIKQIDAQNQMVSIHVTLEKAPFSDEFLIGQYKSYYNLFKYAMIQAGQMPANYDNDFSVSYDDLKQHLVGLKCCLQVGKAHIKGINPYDVFYASKVMKDYDFEDADLYEKYDDGDK